MFAASYIWPPCIRAQRRPLENWKPPLEIHHHCCCCCYCCTIDTLPAPGPVTWTAKRVHMHKKNETCRRNIPTFTGTTSHIKYMHSREGRRFSASSAFRAVWLRWPACSWWMWCWCCSTAWGRRWRDGRRRPPCCCRLGGSAGSPWSWRAWRCCRCLLTSGYSGTESGNTCRTGRRHRRRETVNAALG